MPRSIPREQIETALRKFADVFSRLSTLERLTALRVLPEEAESWTDELFRCLLKDDLAPIRLTALASLLEHPRRGFDAELQRIEASDPFPWCRRMAHEVRIFQADPLDPDRGIRISFAQ